MFDNYSDWKADFFDMKDDTKDGTVIEPATSADTNWGIAPMDKYVQTSFLLDHLWNRG